MSLPPLAPETRNLIDGALCDASNGNSFENLNPTTGEVLGTAADGTKDDMLRAVAAARTGLRRDGLGREPRVPREVPASALRRVARGEGAVPFHRGARGGCVPLHDGPHARRRPDRDGRLLGRPGGLLRVREAQ